MIFLKLILWG